MSHAPDPFAPPSGSTPEPVGGPVAPPVVTAAHLPAQPAYGAFAAPGAAPGWTPAPAVPAGLATASIVLACVWTALQVLLMVVSFSSAEELTRAESEGVDVFTVYDAVGLMLGAVQLAAFVVSCLWVQASRGFAIAARPAVRHVRGPVWVWLGWLVPVVSLWFPYQVLRDVRAGTPGVARGGLGLWWGSWLAASWIANQAFLSELGAGSRDPAAIPLFEILVTVATLVAAVQWVRIVREVTSAQRAHGRRLAA